ncbi:MAG: hypothetical protein BWX88_04350 [Planctomycetes bacterium ADurb.Bin126]|nr:MAG: hypothetical protein BWX88_04350 [Planctomycetes bacterium ADurb.Bin126]
MHVHDTHEGKPLTPEKRRQAVAVILAAGILRCRRITNLTSCAGAKESADPRPICLEPSRPTRLPVPTGSGGYDPRDPEKGRRQ